MKFQLGRVVATAGVDRWMKSSPVNVGFVANSITRHSQGDWGDVCDDDKQLNNQALEHGDRVLSSYSHSDTKIWVITECDRSCTTILFPEEY